MTYSEKKEGLISLCYYAALLFLGYFFLKYCFTTCLPFLVGALVASVLKPAVVFCSKHSKLPQKFISALVVIGFYTLVVLFVFFFGAAIFAKLKSFFIEIPAVFSNTVFPALYRFVLNLEQSVFSNFPLLKQIDLSALFDSVQQLAGKLSTWGIGLLTDTVMVFPSFIMGVFLTIISTFFISGDYFKITNFLKEILPQKQYTLVVNLQKGALKSVKVFVASQFQLMVVTFFMLSVGLRVLKVGNPIFTAAVISLVDFLPVLGTGVVLIPWILVESVMGNMPLSIGLLVVFAVITAVRNVLEPKIMGAQTGFHPLITLMAIYFGGKLFGVFGVFLAPFLLNVGKQVYSDKKSVDKFGK